MEKEQLKTRLEKAYNLYEVANSGMVAKSRGVRPDKKSFVDGGLAALSILRESQNSSTSDEALHIGSVVGSLPDPYKGDLNTERIAEYRKLKPLYALDGGSIRDLFCSGLDWYKSVIERQ